MITSKRAKEEVNWDSICSKRVSRPATFDAVSDKRDKEASSGLLYLIGANDSDWVGVVAIVFAVPVELVSFFFFKALLAVLRKVEIESVSLYRLMDTPSLDGTSNSTVVEDKRVAALSVRS
jgi:hypothetical protein